VCYQLLLLVGDYSVFLHTTELCATLRTVLCCRASDRVSGKLGNPAKRARNNEELSQQSKSPWYGVLIENVVTVRLVSRGTNEERTERVK